jgi:H/ACA ribonucleoprotein complex subunit 4
MEVNIDGLRKKKPIEELMNFCIINVDKPAGCTSFDVADKVRKIAGAKKSGHFGTLDPMVTGVLPIALNRACKLVGFFMKKDKTYVGKMQLHSEISEEKLKEEMKKFLGKIIQMPPVKSSVKRVERERTVNRFELLGMEGKKASFIADVEAGTYIRKLISDLGESIGGANMIELRRIKAGIFEEDESHKIEEIEEAYQNYKEGDEEHLRKILIPAEIISKILPIVQVKEDNLKQILTGKPLTQADLNEKLPQGELFALFLGDRFIEVARDSYEGDVILRPEFVMN